MAANKRYASRHQPSPVAAFSRAAELAEALTSQLSEFTMDRGIAGPVPPMDVYHMAKCVATIGRVLTIVAADAQDAAEAATGSGDAA